MRFYNFHMKNDVWCKYKKRCLKVVIVNYEHTHTFCKHQVVIHLKFCTLVVLMGSYNLPFKSFV